MHTPASPHVQAACCPPEVGKPPDAYVCHVLPFRGPPLPTGKSSTPLACSLRPFKLSLCSTSLIALLACSVALRTCLTILFPVFVPTKMSPHSASELLLILQNPPQHGLSYADLVPPFSELQWHSGLPFPDDTTLGRPGQGLCLLHCWVIAPPQCLAPSLSVG